MSGEKTVFDYTGSFPATFYFFDVKEEKMKKVEVPENCFKDSKEMLQGQGREPFTLAAFMAKDKRTTVDDVIV